MNKTPEEIQKAWEEAVIKLEKELGGKYVKKEFTFTVGELRQLIKLYTIETLAHQTIDDKLNNDILKRVNVEPNANMKINYDLSAGRFVLFNPKEFSSPDSKLKK